MKNLSQNYTLKSTVGQHNLWPIANNLPLFWNRNNFLYLMTKKLELNKMPLENCGGKMIFRQKRSYATVTHGVFINY